MRKILPAFALLFISLMVKAQLKNPDVVKGELIAITPALKDLKPSTKPDVITRDLKGIIGLIKDNSAFAYKDYGSRYNGPDPVLQEKNSPTSGIEADNAIILRNFDGQGYTAVAPADPILSVGPNHVIQMINGSSGSYFRVYDKNGTVVVAQTYLDNLVSGSGYNGSGDPITFYDHFADRFVMAEFGAPTGAPAGTINTLVLFVSATNNPAGSWYVYKFTDAAFMPDYPKFTLWTDAYYAISRDFAPGYIGQSLYAFDRTKMLAGDPTATVQRFRLTGDIWKSNSTISVHSIGVPPPAGTPGMFLYYNDDNLTASTTDVDSVGIITFKVDFANPANTQLVNADQMVVAPFKSQVCPTRNCVPSPSGVGYDAISDRIMNRPYYRNFGTHQAIVLTHTVDAGAAKAAMRWYELRKTTGNWSVYQQGTYSPDNMHRYMGAITINAHGQIALGYNSGGATRFSSISFTGRNASDPLNQMTYEETDVIIGDGYGTFGNRWGDYNEMAPDPANDSIFWFTGMYGSTNWKTRIHSFKLAPIPAIDARMVSINNPVNGTAQCSNVITPNITFKNSGTATLTSATINVRLDAGALTTTPWTGSITQGQSVTVSLPSITAAAGPHVLRVYVTNPNGLPDENPTNDSAVVSFTILAPVAGPITEGFESTTVPPPGWRIINPTGGITWTRTTAARKSGVASMYINLYNYTATNALDYLVAPILDVNNSDSVLVDFQRAYKRYSTNAAEQDTLMIQVSTDCGVTFPITAWKKGGPELASVTGTTGLVNWAPGANDWLREVVDIKPFIGNATSITVAFVSKNRYGQNMYLDDINIRIGILPRRDALVRSIIEPASRICATGNLLPSVEIGSLGRDTLKSVKIMFRLNNNALDSVLWTGNLAKDKFTTVNLKNINLATTGNYTFTAYTKEPNGLSDDNPANDTMRINFIVLTAQPTPVKEGFEQPIFPPANWAVDSSRTGYSWERTTRAASEGVASAWIRNYRFNSGGKKDDLYSPLLQIGAVDSVYIKFDLANAAAKFPGSTALALDTLEVLLTTDCGKTFQSVYKKWGEDLQTVNNPNFPYIYPASDTLGFIPNNLNLWRSEFIDVSKVVAPNSKVQVVFRNSSNKGNNTYLDNVSISTVTLPARLKQTGYLISPTPFESSFVIQHLLPPVNLKGIQVIDAAGKTVVERSFNGGATNNMRIDMSRFANGIYHVKLVYNNKVITERIVKRK